MKLRNKKDREAVELKLIQVNGKYLLDHEVDLLNGEKLTLELLVNSFGDVKEPLIKDTECREIMRLWADRCGVKTVRLFGSEFRYGAKSICFSDDFGLEHLKLYTIDELCGGKEE